MGFLKMGDDLTNFAEVRGKLATAREENRELDAALTAANLRVEALEAKLTTVRDEREGYRQHFRAAKEAHDRLSARMDARVVELEHSLSDAMDQIAAIQGSNAVHMARVEELEDEKLALDTCWNCKVTLEKAGSPESRVPRCTNCLEPESMDEVEQIGEWATDHIGEEEQS